MKLSASHKRGRPITWAQINLAATEDLQALIRRNRFAAELVLALMRQMQPGGGGVVVASRQTMCELIGASMPSVERALRLLIDEGWVQRIKVGGAHALAINSRVAWVGPRDDLPHAVFTATVIASRAEQDAAALNPPPIRHVPVLMPDEIPLPVGDGLPPPSQPGLVGVEPAVARTRAVDDAADREALEARGQQRLPDPLL